MTVETPRIELSVEGRLARVTLSRSSLRNAFDVAMVAEFEDVLHELRRHETAEVVVLTGRGPAFCGGTDLKELATLDASTTMQVQRRTSHLVEEWHRLDQTTVTAFNGPAIGSGAILGLASDLRVAAGSCFFLFPELAFGIPLTWSGIAVLADLVGADTAKRWLLTGEQVESERIESYDLARVVPEGALSDEVDRLAEHLLALPYVGRSMTKKAALLAGPRFEASAHDSHLGALSVALRGSVAFPRPQR